MTARAPRPTSGVTSDELRRVVSETDWEFRDAPTQGLTHGIHRYSGKFIPQIAARAIEVLTAPGEFVLDPLCGSGTTVVETAVLGRRGVGIDLNPLAVRIARAKITPVSAASRKEMLSSMLAAVEALEAQRQGALWSSNDGVPSEVIDSDPRLNDPWFTKWFAADILRDLVAIDLAINRLAPPDARGLAKVAFSDILRRSSRAHSGYPNVMFDKNAPPRERPGRPFLAALQRACTLVGALDSGMVDWRAVSVRLGDATDLDLEDSSVDAIVSHPPYIGSVPYAEYGLLSLKWLGVDPKDLDRALIGGRRQSVDVEKRFRHSYGRMLTEAGRVIKPGRHMFLMVGNPTVRGEVVDLRAMTIELAAAAGFDLVAEATRSGVNRRANKMGDEALLFFRQAGTLERAAFSA